MTAQAIGNDQQGKLRTDQIGHAVLVAVPVPCRSELIEFKIHRLAITIANLLPRCTKVLSAKTLHGMPAGDCSGKKYKITVMDGKNSTSCNDAQASFIY